MRLKTRVFVIVAASLLSLAVMGLFGLYSLRQALLEERRAQIAQLLDFADSQLKYFHGLEISGALSLDEAQERAKQAIGAQRQGETNYFFIRSLKDDYFVHHPIAERVGKPDDGGKLADGRSVVQAYREGLASSTNNKAFLELPTTKPGDPTKTLYPKLNGVLKFEPWGWMPGIGFYIDDINARFWMQSSIFLAVGAVLFVILSFLTFRMRGAILSQLGGEPQDAADNMRKIANGDLSVVVPVEAGDNTSMMASLKLMQMKLTNLTSAIQENAVTLVDQVQKFDGVAKTYADSRLEEDFSALSRAVKKLGKTADILGKSISRFKM